MAGELGQLRWWRTEVLPSLGPDAAEDTATAEAIACSATLCQRPLGELLPNLALVCDSAPSEHLETARALNIIRRCSSDTWADLAERSAEELHTWPNAGHKTVTEIIKTAVRVWERAAPRPRPPASEREQAAALTSDHNERSSFGRRAQQLLLELCSAAYRSGMQDFRGAVEFASASGHEAGAAANAWNELGALPLDDLIDLPGGIEDAWQALLSFDERERCVLEARTFVIGPRITLGELGEKFAVSRERIRQIERGAGKKFEERLASEPVCARILHLAARLRRELGSVAPDESVKAALSKALSGRQDSDLRRAVLIYLAGPYRLNDGFWQRETELADLRAGLVQRADEPLTEADLDRLLAEAGVVQEHRASCIAALPVHRFDDRILVWSGSLADKAARILCVHGDPMSREDLHDAVGADVNARSLLMQVQDDERFRRMSRDTYGLAEWGGEEYTTIADEIEQAIERRGGRAFLDELVDELVDLFGVSPNSVRSYAGSRRFLRQPDGTLAIVLRGHESVKVVPMAPELDQDLVRHRGVWTVRLVVDDNVLRGSGRPVRNAIAQAAGLRPGGARKIQLQNGSTQISWSSNQPALGSTRLIVESLGCEVGDHLFVPLQDGQRAFAVRRVELDVARGLSRLSLELGLPANAELSSIATALGLSVDASAADLRTRLRARRQDQLEALVPSDEDADDDELLAQLIGLGE
jgi:Sigma-70, region 4/Bacterial RNA polymerase, alpha chain C terminal domain